MEGGGASADPVVLGLNSFGSSLLSCLGVGIRRCNDPDPVIWIHRPAYNCSLSKNWESLESLLESKYANYATMEKGMSFTLLCTVQSSDQTKNSKCFLNHNTPRGGGDDMTRLAQY